MGCTRILLRRPTELADVAVRHEEFQEQNAQVLTLSVDSVYSHKIWSETELSKMVWGGVPFPMLSDNMGQIGSMYGCYDEQGGRDLRATYIIDPDGNVQSIEMLSNSIGRNPEEILRQLRALQHTRKTGELIPSGWTMGDKTLRKSTDLAGKVWEQWHVTN